MGAIEEDVAASEPREDGSRAREHGANDAQRSVATVAQDVLVPPAMRGSVGSRSEADLTTDLWTTTVDLLRRRTGHDFSFYKPTMMRRRMDQRLGVHQLRSLSDYVQLLEEQPAEIDRLFKELLIGVSSFFRDPVAFESLRASLLELVAAKPRGDKIRVWVPGCSTGEEAYSIAILLFECAELADKAVDFQIFATDLDADAVSTARAGVYSAKIKESVDATRLARFFVEQEGAYRVREALRSRIIFARHDLLADPPFTKLDLVSCRNVLIYFEAALQTQIVRLFEYALREGGLLFVGTSESIGISEQLSPIDARAKTFRRTELRSRRGTAFPLRATELSREPRPQEARMRSAVEALLLEYAVPPAVLIKEDGTLLFVHGRLGSFLEPARGSGAARNVVTMARPGLASQLDALLQRARVEQGELLARDVSFGANEGRARVDLRVTRFAAPDLEGHLLVTFENLRDEPALSNDDAAADRIGHLERDLFAVEGWFQRTVAELAAANEELSAATQDLASANEELATAKEEVQSLNEELATLNEELRQKVHALTRANDDMRNLISAADVAAVFVDRSLCVRDFTPGSGELASSVTDAAVGDEATSRRLRPELRDDARMVLETLAVRERDLSTRSGAPCRIRIRPYRTAENVIDGLVVTVLEAPSRAGAVAPRDHDRHHGGTP